VDDHSPVRRNPKHTTILFACVHNAGRSQIAVALFNRLADPARARAISAGTRPAARVHPEVSDALREIGIEIGGVVPRLLTPELAAGASWLVTMGCGDECPVVPGAIREDWPLEDPKGLPPDRVRAIRHDIEGRVRALIEAQGWGRGPAPRPLPPLALAVLARGLPAWAGVTVLALLVEVSVQQAHRTAANDPQIQIAEDGARALARGADPRALAGGPTVDLASSLAVWVTVCDGGNHVLASTATLDGRTPVVPAGVLETARARGQDRVTWQPRPGVRSATVSVAVPGGTRMVVTAGRSLREVEVREDQLQVRVAAAWLAALLGILLAAAVGEWLAHPGARA
jgi:arsenate reductase